MGGSSGGAPAPARLLVWNIRYGTGTGLAFNLPFPAAGYLRSTRRRLKAMQATVATLAPDVMTLIETDLGSMRAGTCQATALARAAGHGGVLGECKYGLESRLRHLPLLRHQGNALSARHLEAPRRHWLSTGSKRLVLEARAGPVVVFAVHLSVGARQRHRQLAELAGLVRRADAPPIVAGDFNTLNDDAELDDFLAATGLRRPASAARLATWPSLAPRRQLDYVLAHGSIDVLSLRVLTDIRLSDHLPLLCEFRAGV